MSLTEQQIQEFHTNGVLIIKQFYDLKTEIEPILRSIYSIVGRVIEREGLQIEREEFSLDTFDSGFMELIEYDRSLGGVIYDAVKQIPAFVRLIACEKNEELFKQLFNASSPGVAHGGQGIRIDIPFEEKFRAPWHQEYLNQLKSKQGAVFWSPLLHITDDLGPVEFCLKSNHSDVFPVLMYDKNNLDKTGAYAMVIDNEEEVVTQYEKVAPLTNPGDLVLVDWLVLHRSGSNKGNRCRWSMQMRYFDFSEETGISNSWVGSFASGVDVRDIHPEYIVLR